MVRLNCKCKKFIPCNENFILLTVITALPGPGGRSGVWPVLGPLISKQDKKCPFGASGIRLYRFRAQEGWHFSCKLSGLAYTHMVSELGAARTGPPETGEHI